MILPIKIYGDTILKKKCKEIDINQYKVHVHRIINDMFDTLYQNCGVGLAAPQIGKSLRLFIIDTLSKKNTCKRVFINPIIIKIYGRIWKLKEGCLSLPNIDLKIARYELIHILYYNEHLKKCEEIFQGIESRIIQHEYDHIEGKLIIDY